MPDALLEIKNLKTHFSLDEGVLTAVDGVDLVVKKNTTLCLVGESGCGKSMTGLSIMRLEPSPGKIVDGSIVYHPDGGESVDLAALNPRGPEIRAIRGKHISMIFQEPMTSLSPVHTIGRQITEMILIHRTPDRDEARKIAIEMLDKVGIPNPSQRIDAYPFQLSGGLRQRAMIAMALSCEPALLIADEPTTALDVTVQAQIIQLIRELKEEFGMAILYVTHNFGVIAQVADEVAVMYLGRVVEQADIKTLFRNPLHPYTRLLLKSVPNPGVNRGGRLETIKGTVPTPIGLPPECGFFSRCPSAIDGECNIAVPQMLEVEPGHWVRCVLFNNERVPG